MTSSVAETNFKLIISMIMGMSFVEVILNIKTVEQLYPGPGGVL